MTTGMTMGTIMVTARRPRPSLVEMPGGAIQGFFSMPAKIFHMFFLPFHEFHAVLAGFVAGIHATGEYNPQPNASAVWPRLQFGRQFFHNADGDVCSSRGCTALMSVPDHVQPSTAPLSVASRSLQRRLRLRLPSLSVSKYTPYRAPCRIVITASSSAFMNVAFFTTRASPPPAAPAPAL